MKKNIIIGAFALFGSATIATAHFTSTASNDCCKPKSECCKKGAACCEGEKAGATSMLNATPASGDLEKSCSMGCC